MSIYRTVMKEGAECPKLVPLEQKQSKQVWEVKYHVTDTSERQLVLFREGPMHLGLLGKDFFLAAD